MAGSQIAALIGAARAMQKPKTFLGGNRKPPADQVIFARARGVGRVASLSEGEHGVVNIVGGDLSLIAAGKPLGSLDNAMKLQLLDEFAGTEFKSQPLSRIPDVLPGGLPKSSIRVRMAEAAAAGPRAISSVPQRAPGSRRRETTNWSRSTLRARTTALAETRYSSLLERSDCSPHLCWASSNRSINPASVISVSVREVR